MILFSYVRELVQYTIRSVRIWWGFIGNLGALIWLPRPIVTVFGGSKATVGGMHNKWAYKLGRLCSEHGISVITGGGPGIMYAANCGAASVDLEKGKKVTHTLGIAVKGVDEGFCDPCIPTIRLRYFFMRKWFLMQFSSAIVVFPGGIGTMDELFDVLNLLKHNMLPDMPVVLIDRKFWQPLLDWFNNSAVEQKLINPHLLELFIVTDSIEEAFELIHKVCKQHQR